MIVMLLKLVDKLLCESLSVKGEVPEGDWLNWAVKVTVKWKIIEIYDQHGEQEFRHLVLLQPVRYM